MKKIILFVLSFFAFMEQCCAMTIDQKIDAIVAPASDFLSNKIVFVTLRYLCRANRKFKRYMYERVY